MTNEMSIDVLKNFIFKIAEQAYITNDTFNNVKAGIVQEHISNKYKVLLNNSTVPVEATLFYSNEKINKNDYVYLIEAFDNANPNFINYYIFGKVGDVQEEIGKSDWSRFIAAEGEGGSETLANIEWRNIRNEPLEYNNENFINSINNNGYFAIYGDFTCISEDLKEYGLNITLTFEDEEVFVYKFSSQDFIGQPFSIDKSLTQKKLFKIQKKITKLSIQGFDIKKNGGINTSDKIGLSNLTIVAGSLYMLDPSIEVKIAAAAGAKEYFVGVGQEQIKLHAEITQNGQSVFSDLINYIWYINDPDKQETDEDYWKCLHQQENITLTDIEGHSITIPSIGSKASNLILYRGTQPTISETESEDNYLYDFGANNIAENEKDKIKHFNRKIKCEITYEGTSIESNIFDLWDYNNEDYDVRIDSNIRPVAFYAGDDIDNSIELTAVRTGGPEKNGPKHDFKFKWSYASDNVGRIYKVTENNSTGVVEDIEIDANDDILKEKTIVLYLSQGSYETKSKFIGKYVIRETVKLQCDLFINDEIESYDSANQEVKVVQNQETIIETHYQYYVVGGLEAGEVYFPSFDTKKIVVEGLKDVNGFTITKITPNIGGERPITDPEKIKTFFSWSPNESNNSVTITLIHSSNPGYFIEYKTNYVYPSGWNGVTFEKAFRHFPLTDDPSKTVIDSNWYGDWNIIDKNNSGVTWDQNGLAKVTWECTNENFAPNTTEFNYEYEYDGTGVANTQALKKILDIKLSPYQAIYVTNRRVWLEKQSDNYFLVGRQEEWVYPQILKAVKGDGKELDQEALDKLNVFNSLTAGGRDQEMFFEDVYMLTKDLTAQSGKFYYKKQYNEGDGSFTYEEDKSLSVGDNLEGQFLYELKKDQVYINAEYIQTGALRVGDPEQGHIFYADIDQQEVEIGGFTVDKNTLKTNDYSVVYENLFKFIDFSIEDAGVSVTEVFGPYEIEDTDFIYYSLDCEIDKTLIESASGRKHILIPPEGHNGTSYFFNKDNRMAVGYFNVTIKNEHKIWYDIGVSKTALNTLLSTINTFTIDHLAQEEIYIKFKTEFLLANGGFAFSSDQNKNMIDSKHFKVDHDGKIQAENADIDGRIRARELYIGDYDRGLEDNELITNGDGAYQNNTNFSKFVYRFFISEGAFFECTGDNRYVSTDEVLSIDPTQLYHFNIDAKSSNASKIHYTYIKCFDADKKEISVRNHHRKVNTLCRVVGHYDNNNQPVTSGSFSRIQLTCVDGNPWTLGPDTEKHIMFWNYKDSFGRQYDKNTYSRNLYNISAIVDGLSISTTTFGIEFNTASLFPPSGSDKIPLTVENFPIGTYCSQCLDGGTYKYTAISGINVPSDKWTHYSSIFGGVDYSGENKTNMFPPGTKYAQIGFIIGYGSGENTTLNIANVSLQKQNVNSEFIVEDSYIKMKTKDLVIASDNFNLNWNPTLNSGNGGYQNKYFDIDTDYFKLQNKEENGNTLLNCIIGSWQINNNSFYDSDEQFFLIANNGQENQAKSLNIINNVNQEELLTYYRIKSGSTTNLSSHHSIISVNRNPPLQTTFNVYDHLLDPSGEYTIELYNIKESGERIELVNGSDYSFNIDKDQNKINVTISKSLTMNSQVEIFCYYNAMNYYLLQDGSLKTNFLNTYNLLTHSLQTNNLILKTKNNLNQFTFSEDKFFGKSENNSFLIWSDGKVKCKNLDLFEYGSINFDNGMINISAKKGTATGESQLNFVIEFDHELNSNGDLMKVNRNKFTIKFTENCNIIHEDITFYCYLTYTGYDSFAQQNVSKIVNQKVVFYPTSGQILKDTSKLVEFNQYEIITSSVGIGFIAAEPKKLSFAINQEVDKTNVSDNAVIIHYSNFTVPKSGGDLLIINGSNCPPSNIYMTPNMGGNLTYHKREGRHFLGENSYAWEGLYLLDQNFYNWKVCLKTDSNGNPYFAFEKESYPNEDKIR